MNNASSRKDIRAAEKSAKLRATERQSVIVGLMSTTPGRAYIFEELEAAHVFESSFTADPLSTAFREGERSQGLRILAEVMIHCTEEFILAMREANERRTAAERSRSQNGNGGDQGSGEPYLDDYVHGGPYEADGPLEGTYTVRGN